MNTYSERLEYALAQSGQPRKTLCAVLGITPQALGQVLSAKTKFLTAENSARAAKFLGVDHHWLATGEGQPVTQKQFDHWPFPNLPPSDYAQLPPIQQAAIESWVIAQVQAFTEPALPVFEEPKKMRA